MSARPLTPDALVAELAERVAALSSVGRATRVLIDGAPPSDPAGWAQALVEPLQVRGRPVLRGVRRRFPAACVAAPRARPDERGRLLLRPAGPRSVAAGASTITYGSTCRASPRSSTPSAGSTSTWVRLRSRSPASARSASSSSRPGTSRRVSRTSTASKRCLIQYLVDQKSPTDVLRNFRAVAAATTNSLSTNIPQNMLPALVALAAKARERPLQSIAFDPSLPDPDAPDGTFSTTRPDFSYLRQVVRNALDPNTAPVATPAQKPRLPVRACAPPRPQCGAGGVLDS